MKILIVHNYYREPGGEDECAHSEAELLQEHGHQVVWYTLRNADVRPAVGSAARSLWSRESHAALRALIRRERPQLAHFHNISHRVSPSGYWAAVAEGLPVVQTLHNYRPLCCNALLFREGKPCEDCVGKRLPWRGVARACYRDSAAASLAVAAVTTVHRALRTWRDPINMYVAPSEFLRSRFVAAGFPADRIVVKPNFVHPDPELGSGNAGFALFVGRLSPEKGVETLLRAWELLGDTIPLRIVGDGPLSEHVAETAKTRCLEWLGRRGPVEVLDQMGRARCVVIPSECYENFPRVLAEAFSKGTPAIVSDAGAAGDLVTDGRTGFHFRAGNPFDLARVVRRAFSAQVDLPAMRRHAREEYLSKYTGNANHQLLMSIYARAIDLQRASHKTSTSISVEMHR